MKINSIEITGVGGLSSVNLRFHPQMNFICGPNGIGKTTIIECIAHTFSNGNTNILKHHSRIQTGVIKANIQNSNLNQNVELLIGEFEPDKPSMIKGLHNFSKLLISLKTTRLFEYKKLISVERDKTKNSQSSWAEAMNGISLLDIKGWFINRFLYSAHPGALDEIQLHNFDIAKRCFSFLDPNFSFSRVVASTNEIVVSSPSGDIYYEYLSSGFKSTLSILFGIIKELEYRFSENRLRVDDFDGIIVIDELELHLHPEWQVRISDILMKVFPNAQFITTTHSPHIIQCAEPNQIIALEYLEGKPIQRELTNSSYGFKGWSIEEVLEDVMGMKTLRTEFFTSTIKEFNDAIKSNNAFDAQRAYEKLDELLHPSSSLKKLLKLQLALIVENLE